MNPSRRLFLKSGALALASVGMMPGWGPRFLRETVFAAEPKRAAGGAGGRKILICIFQRGAVDGLSMIVPHGDPNYYQLRSTNGGIALPRTGDGAVLDLDGQFGLNPAMQVLKPLYDKGFLAPVQAVGSPHATRSHFDAQDYMESAIPGNKSVHEGWLTRVLEQCPEDAARKAAGKASVRAVSLTPQLPRSFEGDDHALAVGDLRSFGVGMKGGGAPKNQKGKREMPAMTNAPRDPAGGFEALYAGAVGDVLHGAGQETFEALKLLNSLKPDQYQPEKGAKYPGGRYGQSLQQIAQLIKADVGLEIAFAETGGWDTHVNQGGSQGQLSRRLGEFAQGLSALWTDLGDRMADVTIVTMSEFGRTARQNGNGGTDHGHGTCFLTLGGNVRGGKVLGQWPGLAPEQLNEKRDLAVTTDFRDVFGEIAARHLGVKDLSAVFPGYETGPKKFRGILKG